MAHTSKFWQHIRRCALLLLLPFLASIRLFGQVSNLRFDHISANQGLSQATVNAILQDQQGFMWFGTQDGLNRFDGYTFTVFREIQSDTQSISDNYIWCLLQDRDGRIWAGTLNNGLNCYRPDEDRFTRYLHNSRDTGSVGSNNITALCQDSEGTLWVGTWGEGVNRFDAKRNRFIHFLREPENPNSLGNDFVRCILEDRPGHLWVGTWAGLVSFDRRAGTITRYRHDPRNPRSISGDHIVSVHRDNSGRLWAIAMGAGLNVLDTTGKGFIHYRNDHAKPRSLGSDAIVSMCQDSTGSLWFGFSDAGVSRFEPASGEFTTFRRDPAVPRALCSDRVYSLYTDHTGAIWVGTADAGLSRYDPNKPKFFDLFEFPGARTSLSHDAVRAIYEDRKGNLWIGSAGGGLSRFSRTGKKSVHYSHTPNDPQSLSSNFVVVLFEDRKGTLWVGTDGGGLNRFDERRKEFVHYRQEADGRRKISGNSIMSIAEDRGGTLWVGTTGSGLNRYDRKRDTFIPFSFGGNAPSESEGSVWAIHEDSHGYLWIGTWGAGLRRYDRATHQVKHFVHNPADATSLGNNTVWSVYEDSAGILWFGTWGGGLNRYDSNTETFSRFTKEDGLSNNVVYGILPDGEGNLWLSTNDGISKFNPATKAVKTYDELDGLQGSEFNQGAYCRGRDGILYFGGTDGVSVFQPDSIRMNLNVPPIVLTAFKIFDKPVTLPRSITAVDEIAVSYNDNFIAFEFAALDFSAPGKNQYAYRLEGFDRDWIYCGTRRYAAYTGLHGGSYLFRVKGSNSDGVWNETGRVVRIVVRPPFWSTWWFILLGITITLLTLFAFYRYRIRQIVAMERLRTRLASDLHDEIASNLSSMALFSNLVRNASVLSGSIPSEHMRLLERITALAQESVTSIRDIIWAIDTKPETVYDLLVRLKDLLTPICRAHNLQLVFPGPMRGDLPVGNLTPEQRKHLWLFLKEAAFNAIKHARCTELGVLYDYSSHEMRLIVRDNGCGFDPSSASTGKGMSTIAMRAGLLDGSVDVVSAPGKGTSVRLTFRI
jgi:ligand-binding sensor domain-containing protein